MTPLIKPSPFQKMNHMLTSSLTTLSFTTAKPLTPSKRPQPAQPKGPLGRLLGWQPKLRRAHSSSPARKGPPQWLTPPPPDPWCLAPFPPRKSWVVGFMKANGLRLGLFWVAFSWCWPMVALMYVNCEVHHYLILFESTVITNLTSACRVNYQPHAIKRLATRSLLKPFVDK